MENIFDKESYIQFVNDHRPQPHQGKWTDEEENIILVCIKNAASLSDIKKVIRLRTNGAICTKANHLGYGNKRNKNDGHTYFHKEINHKNRRTKDEISEEREKVPIESTNSTGTNIEVDSDIISKVEISVADIDIITDILTRVRSSAAAGDL